MLTIVSSTFAVAEPLTFTPIGQDRGMKASVPADLLFDRRGFLWVGSREGLYRYDGYRATLFAPDVNDPDAITDFDIRALYEDRDGLIWVATNTGGLNRLDPTTGRFRSYRHGPTDDTTISHDSVYGMTEDGDGFLWAGSQIGLNRYDPASETFTRYLNDPDDPASLSHDYVYDVYLDRQDVLWVATVGGGLNRYNAASDTFTRFDLAGMVDGSADCNDVFGLTEDAGGRLWVGSRCGLIRFDPSGGSAERVDLSVLRAEKPTVTRIIRDARGRLWLGTLVSGVIRFDPETGDTRAYTDYSPSEPGGLAAQPQLGLAFKDDALFVGVWGAGVWMAHLPDATFELLGAAVDKQGLRQSTIMAILPGDQPGDLWVGSFGGGPQPADIAARRFGQPDGQPEALAEESVMALARAADGRLFAGTSNGLWEMAPDGAVRRLYEHGSGEPGSLGEGYVVSLYFDADDALWVGVGGSGLHRLSPGERTFEVFRHEPTRGTSLSGNFITTIAGDGPDHLWVGTRSNGLNRCRTSAWSCQRFGVAADGEGGLGHFHVTAVRRDNRGRVWVGTDGGGLHEVLRTADGEVAGFRRWTEKDGLISDAVMAMEADSDDSLWVSTRHGLTRLDPDQGRSINYVEQSGLPVVHFSGNSSASDDRYLYFGSVDGLLAIPRGGAMSPRPATPVRITAAEKIGQQRYRPMTGWVPDVVAADYGDMLAIQFAVLDYAEVPHRYEFRLGERGEWTPLGQRTDVTFLDLAPGRHQFTVRGRDVFGRWGASAPLGVEVVPPFWMTTWFRLLLIVALLGAGYGFHRLRTLRLKRQALEVQRLSELREQALEQALGDRSELAGLTPRQKEVLQLIAEGHSTREIAERLDLSVKTIETHRANLMERLDIRDVPGLVRLAIRARLVSPHG